MKVGILDPFSGISGDMTLGALLDVGLDPEWLRALPPSLGLDGVGVRIADVKRGEIACKKVDFDIPPQPHGRHLRQLQEIVSRSVAPPAVKARANRAFTLIAEQESVIHATTVERVHLHEVGAVDAILDVVGSVWGFELLGLERVYCSAIALGDGVVDDRLDVGAGFNKTVYTISNENNGDGNPNPSLDSTSVRMRSRAVSLIFAVTKMQ